MKDEKLQLVNFVKIYSGIGCSIGVLIFAISLFVNGFTKIDILSIVGITVLLNSMLIFGIGLFFAITDEMVSKTMKGSPVLTPGLNGEGKSVRNLKIVEREEEA